MTLEHTLRILETLPHELRRYWEERTLGAETSIPDLNQKKKEAEFELLSLTIFLRIIHFAVVCLTMSVGSVGLLYSNVTRDAGIFVFIVLGLDLFISSVIKKKKKQEQESLKMTDHILEVALAQFARDVLPLCSRDEQKVVIIRNTGDMQQALLKFRLSEAMFRRQLMALRGHNPLIVLPLINRLAEETAHMQQALPALEKANVDFGFNVNIHNQSVSVHEIRVVVPDEPL